MRSQGFELLKAIHRNVAQYTRSGGDPSLLAGRGEVAIGVSFANDVVERGRKGFPIHFVAPKDGTGLRDRRHRAGEGCPQPGQRHAA